MAVENLKSTAITNLDATPVVANSTGTGAAGVLYQVDGYATPSNSASTTSTYRLVRVPSQAIIKEVLFEAGAMTAGKFNLSVYYSDSTVDGTKVANQGVIVPTTGDSFFASDIDCSSAVSKGDKTNQSGNYTLDLRGKQLWDALAISSDPGGWMDIVAVCHTTAVTTGAKLGVDVRYTMP